MILIVYLMIFLLLIIDVIDLDFGFFGDNKKGICVLYVLRLSFGGWLGLDVDIYFIVSFD